MAAHPADGKLKLHLANVQTSQFPFDGSRSRGCRTLWFARVRAFFVNAESTCARLRSAAKSLAALQYNSVLTLEGWVSG